MISVLHRPERRCGAPPLTLFAFTWAVVSGATSYVLQIGTATTLSDVYEANVGNVLQASVALRSGTYVSRTVVVGGAHDGELTLNGEQPVTVP